MLTSSETDLIATPIQTFGKQIKRKEKRSQANENKKEAHREKVYFKIN